MSSEFKITWRLLQPHARPRAPLLAAVFLLGAVTAAQAAVLVLVQPVWRLVLFPEEESITPGGLEETQGRMIALVEGASDVLRSWGWAEDPRVAALLVTALFTITLGLVTASAQFGFTWLSRRVSLGMIVDLRIRLARHLIGLSMRYHNERRFGDLLSRVSSDVTMTLSAINVGLKGLVLQPLQGMGYLLMALWIAPLPTAGMLLLLPIAALPMSRLTRKVRMRSTKSLSTLGSSVQALSQMFHGIRTVKAFGAEEVELERYRELNHDYLRTSMKMVRSIAKTHAWAALLSTGGFGVILLAVGMATIRFHLFEDGGQMMAFLSAILMLNSSARNSTKSWTRVQEAVGSGVRISEVLDEQIEVVDAPDARPINTITEGLRFEDVDFRYPGAERDALQGISLTVERGETLALVGASGAGKTTVIDLVARFIDATAGRVLADGVDLRELRLSDWTAQYALVGQSPFLFHTSIAENIRYGRPDATEAEIHGAARAANIHEFISSLPGGYDTDVADMGQRLSGGQRQRITIARALLKGAPLLLLDEATSALDSESEAEVQRALERLMADRTVIVIAHRLATVRNADRIAVLDEGRLVELGTHEELLGKGGVYARLHALQELSAPSESAALR